MSSKHFDTNAAESQRTIVPSLWGIIPRWHKGDYRKHGLTTNNARLETLACSKLYKPAIDRGKRCVVPIEGFYEWQTVDMKLRSSERPAYYIYMPQGEKSKNATPEWKLMFLAGLFDVWRDERGDAIYSFTVITFESSEHFSWLHRRTPAVLETETSIRNWLEYNRVPATTALKLLSPPSTILWHRVSNYVNNSRNKSECCKKPLETKQNSLLAWIKTKPENDPKKTIDEK